MDRDICIPVVSNKMKDRVHKILKQVEVDISKFELDSYNIIETSLSMVHHLQGILTDLRNQLQAYVFSSKEEEIFFSKIRNRNY